MKVLVVAAHPDDELLGVGATVAKHADAGDEVTLLVVSEGASSRYASGADEALRASGREAARVLGAKDLRFLGLPDQRLDARPILDVIQPIERVFDEIGPEVVYTHHWGDINRDHRVVSEAVMVAARPVGPRAPRRLLCFETPSASEWSSNDPSLVFVPTLFVDVGATIERKLEAMARYETELRPYPHPRSIDALRVRAQYWGQLAGLRYAEPFVIVREIG